MCPRGIAGDDDDGVLLSSLVGNARAFVLSISGVGVCLSGG